MTEGNLSSENKSYLDYAIDHGASDIHINVGVPVCLRVDGKLFTIPNAPEVTVAKAKELIKGLASEELLESLKQKKEIDFSFAELLMGRAILRNEIKV